MVRAWVEQDYKVFAQAAGMARGLPEGATVSEARSRIGMRRQGLEVVGTEEGSGCVSLGCDTNLLN